MIRLKSVKMQRPKLFPSTASAATGNTLADSVIELVKVTYTHTTIYALF